MNTLIARKVGAVKKVLNEAIESSFNGLKVIIAEGECQLERQRRLKPIKNNAIKMKKRFVRVRYGVDEDT